VPPMVTLALLLAAKGQGLQRRYSFRLGNRCSANPDALSDDQAVFGYSTRRMV
jgi:hypothetical protein